MENTNKVLFEMLETSNKNRKFAEFLGANYTDEKEGGEWMNGILFPHGYNRIMVDALKYHISWDWLMEVVEKIFSLVYEEKYSELSSDLKCDLYIRRIRESFFMPDRKETYKACFQFVKWYMDEPDFFEVEIE